MAKDNGFSARVIFIAPPSIEALEARMRKDEGVSEEEIQRKLKDAEEEIAQYNKSGALYDKVIMNDDLEKAYGELEQFIYEIPIANGVHKEEIADQDVTMEDEANGT
jgi:THO complex subunit 1